MVCGAGEASQLERQGPALGYLWEGEGTMRQPAPGRGDGATTQAALQLGMVRLAPSLDFLVSVYVFFSTHSTGDKMGSLVRSLK